MQIEILSTKATTNPGSKQGTTYQSLEVAYKNLTFQGKVEGRKIMSFGATADTFKTLAASQAGDVFEIEVTKNAKGYNDWVSAKKSQAGTTSAAIPAERGVGSTSPSPRSTYETPEERAKKQVYIVRQSSVGSAIDLLTVGAKLPPKVGEVLDVAKQIEAYVFDQDVDAPLSPEEALLAMEDSVL